MYKWIIRNSIDSVHILLRMYVCVCLYGCVPFSRERETVTNEGFLLRRLFVNLFRYPPRAELIVATFRRDQGYPLSTL